MWTQALESYRVHWWNLKQEGMVLGGSNDDALKVRQVSGLSQEEAEEFRVCLVRCPVLPYAPHMLAFLSVFYGSVALGFRSRRGVSGGMVLSQRW